jgi:hypothetical protein
MQVRIPRHGLTAALAFALALTAAPAAPVTPPKEDKKEETPAEKVKKALDQKIASLEVENQPLAAAVDQLHEETKINFVLDRTTIAQMGIDIDSTPVKAKMKDVKAKAALRNLLNQYGLSYAVVGDSVLITTEEMAVYRQLKQRVSLDLDRVQMDKALKGLARETATNLLIDTKAQKEAQAAVTLQVDDVPLETAVRLLAESAGLKPVRLGNVLLVTTKAHATELRSEPELAPSPRTYPPGADVPVPAVPPGGLLPGAPGGVAPNPPPAPKAVEDKPGKDKPADPDKTEKPAEKKPAEKDKPDELKNVRPPFLGRDRVK